MVASENRHVDLEPYSSLLERKYIPYLLFLFQIYAFISIVVLLDCAHEKERKQSKKMDVLLCFITAVSVGLSLYLLLLYFNVCL
ncbi:conserved Plasmodium protein, unknown function [Plasmodium ovale]|uniref:Dolichyl-diphosphooligosaccharide-protein glycosyltransferase subunit OST5 n=1 Tax=Plasmodium ovale TaxID=36330 RepID=A0A1C3L5X2_PLAOA|nr:conserved Plasmodium protein, unknown function [Plasmodium ovale]